jgi:hypothetical protein
MLPSLASLSIGSLYAKKQRRLDLQVSRSSDVLTHNPGDKTRLHVGCISAAEMITAKTTLDAIVKSKQKGIPVHQVLQKLFRENLWPVWYFIRQFAGPIKERHSADPLDRDIAGWHSLIYLSTVYKRDITPAIADKYLSFLVNYLDQRGISMDELMSVVEDQDEDEDEDEEEGDHGKTYAPGVSPILKEYFHGSFTYAASRYYTDTVRALADVKDKPCVAIVMMAFREDPDYDLSNTLVDINCEKHYRPTFNIQGIVACEIYKLVRRISVGSTFLRFFEDISKETGRYITVYPIGNDRWKRKLANSERVLLDSNRSGMCA